MKSLKNIAQSRVARILMCLAFAAFVALGSTGCDELGDFATGFECGYNASIEGLPVSVCW